MPQKEEYVEVITSWAEVFGIGDKVTPGEIALQAEFWSTHPGVKGLLWEDIEEGIIMWCLEHIFSDIKDGAVKNRILYRTSGIIQRIVQSPWSRYETV